MNDLQWLTEWYKDQTDGEWEHEFGITIATLDNPGWSIQIDLSGTTLRETPFAAEEQQDGDRWSRFWKDDPRGVFHAAGDATALPEMLARFRAWVTANSSLG
jgi:hypothetical protein